MKLCRNSLSKSRFRGILISAMALLIGLFGGMSLFLTSFDEKDLHAYRKLANQTPDENDLHPFSQTAKQRSISMRKDMFFFEGNERLQMRLKSAEAELVLEKHGNENSLVEHMKNVVCDMQEEVYYVLTDGRHVYKQEDGKFLLKNGSEYIPEDSQNLQAMQVIRRLEADAATYHYQQDLFVAENVKVLRYMIPGHKIDDEASHPILMMSGMAKWVEFSLNNKALNFKAYQLKSKFYSGGIL